MKTMKIMGCTSRRPAQALSPPGSHGGSGSSQAGVQSPDNADADDALGSD